MYVVVCSSHELNPVYSLCFGPSLWGFSVLNVHSKLRSVTPVATKVLRSFAVLTWTSDIVELV